MRFLGFSRIVCALWIVGFGLEVGVHTAAYGIEDGLHTIARFGLIIWTMVGLRALLDRLIPTRR